MYVRTSQALIVCPDQGQTIAYNFLKQTSFVCNEDILRLLHCLSDWQTADRVCEVFPEYSSSEIEASLSDLVSAGALVVKGSPDHDEETRKVESWEWGVPSALMHYCEQNRKFASRSDAEAIQRQRALSKPAPNLFRLNSDFEDKVELSHPLGKGTVLDLMVKRRTVREVQQANITREALSDCLFAGLGITSETENCVNKLPLSMTPSGGARNPYEAYVYAQRVEGLKPGFYHYSAMEHSLGLISHGAINDPAALIGDQQWINDMSAIVFLCADFSRTMWKYQDNNAYRVILIEAGHIGQNIMLAATENNLTACPSAALSHEMIADHLKLEHDLQSPVYALMLGHPERNGKQKSLH